MVAQKPPDPARRCQPRLDQRSCGVLLHLTSLPGPQGSGDLGPPAESLAAFLAAAGQSWWQMLPIGPLGPGNSPYSSTSSLAGGWHLISPELLAAEGWLPTRIPTLRRRTPRDRVAYGLALPHRRALLERAWERFRAARRRSDFEPFCRANAGWLDDFALFCALKEAHGQRSWVDWPRPLAMRRPQALREARRQLAERIDYHRFVQYVFDRQWRRFKRACNRRGVALIGDLPIFVSHDSCDVWAHRELFLLDARGRPRVVSGVPPDYFSRTGQLWGHPLYRWPAHRAEGYRWWIARFKAVCDRFDAVRIDHFLGFNRLWNVPAGARTAERGRWTRTPGDEILAAVTAALGRRQIIAEDLGLRVPAAERLRRKWGLPGMRIMQFGFGTGPEALRDRPHNYPRDCVAYTGTHDNETVVGWFNRLPRRGDRGPDGLTTRQRVLAYVGGAPEKIHWNMIRSLYASPADTVIVPLQDILGLDNAARMNTPATTAGNWEWRLPSRTLNMELAKRLRALAIACERYQPART